MNLRGRMSSELGTFGGGYYKWCPTVKQRVFGLTMLHPRRVGGGASLFAKVPRAPAMFRAAVLLLALVAHAECLKPAEAPPRSAVRRHLKPELRPELKPSLVPRPEHVLVAAKTEVVQHGQSSAFSCHSWLPGPPGTHGSGRGLLRVLVAAKTRCACGARHPARTPRRPRHHLRPPCPPRPPRPPQPPCPPCPRRFRALHALRTLHSLQACAPSVPTPCILPALQVTESSVAVGVLAVLGGVLIHLAHS